MKSFFFIPANSSKYLSKIGKLNADELILELEDGIPERDIETALEFIVNIDNYKNYWVRPNMTVIINGKALIDILFELGFRKMIIPKVESIHILQSIEPIINHPESEIILLIESPKLLLELKEIISKFRIKGLAFGIHDFAKSFDTFPHYQNFKPFLLEILLIAKAYNLSYIDCPSMEMDESGKEKFLDELEFITQMGGDGKFILHPKQLQWFNGAELFNEEQIRWALKIHQKMMDNPQSIENFDTLVVDNKIVEKAHLRLVEKIITWYEKRKQLRPLF